MVSPLATLIIYAFDPQGFQKWIGPPHEFCGPIWGPGDDPSKPETVLLEILNSRLKTPHICVSRSTIIHPFFKYFVKNPADMMMLE